MEDILSHIHQHYLFDNEMIHFYFTCRLYYTWFSNVKPHAPMHIDDWKHCEPHERPKHVIIERVEHTQHLNYYDMHTLTYITNTSHSVHVKSVYKLNYVQIQYAAETAFFKSNLLNIGHCEIMNLFVHKFINIKTIDQNSHFQTLTLWNNEHNFSLRINTSLKSLNIVAPKISQLSLQATLQLTHLRIQCYCHIDLYTIFNIPTIEYVCILSDNRKMTTPNKRKNIKLPHQLKHFIHSGEFNQIQCNPSLKSLHVWRCNRLIDVPECKHVIHDDKLKREFIAYFKF